jgi:hypothetical protein
VNFWGTLISQDPIDLGEEGYDELTDDESLALCEMAAYGEKVAV